MKVISYIITPGGNKIVTGINEPNIDPLESKKQAVKKVQKSPEFKALTASIALYKKFVEKCNNDGVKFGRPEDLPDHIREELKIKLSAVMEKQKNLAAMEAQEIKDNPVYLLPFDAIFVEEEKADKINSNLSEDKVVIMSMDVQSEGLIFEVYINDLGKCYRLPDSADWILVEEPDQFIPEDAVFEAPEGAELERIEAARIRGLNPDDRSKEKAARVVGAQNVLMRETIAAEHADTPDKQKEAKKAAGTAYKESLAEIEQLYG